MKIRASEGKLELIEKLGPFVRENLSIGQSHDHREEPEKDTVADRTANRPLSIMKRRLSSFLKSANVRTMLSFSHDASSVATVITFIGNFDRILYIEVSSKSTSNLTTALYTFEPIKDSSRQRS